MSFLGISKIKLTSRHAASAVAIAASIYFSLSQLENERVRQERDLDLGSVILADSLREAVEPLLLADDKARLNLLVEQFGRRGRLAGMAVFDRQGGLVAGSRSLLPLLKVPPRAVAACLAREVEAHDYERLGGSRMRVEALPLHKMHGASGAVAVFHDTWFIEARAQRNRVLGVQRMAIQAVLFLAVVWLFELIFKLT